MGERTQALVTFKYDETEEVSVSIHYQWGYGRVMLMDVLNEAFGLISEGFSLSRKEPVEIAEKIFNRSVGDINLQPSKKENWNLRETMKSVMTCSDNNDGYIHLTVEQTDFFDTNSKLEFFDTYGRPCSLDEYYKKGEMYATEEFKAGYKALLDSYGIDYDFYEGEE